MENRLTFIKEIGRLSGDKTALYQCSCGNTKVIRMYTVKNNTSRSCGCLHKEILSKTFKKHGLSQTKEHSIWKTIIQRCTNPNSQSFDDYGGRGITICNEWRNSFKQFLQDMGNKPDGKSIDRIDNTKGYYKENCKWSTLEEQGKNKRNNRILVLGTKAQTLQEWANELQIDHKVFRRRLALGWTDEEILTIKPISRK